MMQQISPSTAIGEVRYMLRRYWRRWAIPAVLIAGACTYYALAIYQPYWEVSQALTVRNEASFGTDNSDQFETPESLKNTQETIFELVKSPSVLRAALAEVGPPAVRHRGTGTQSWPAAVDLEQARRNIKITPPNGTELGTTELFYLTVQDPSRKRALRLIAALCTQLERRFKRLRNRKTDSVILELTKAAALAKKKLDQAVQQVTKIEQQVGTDLAELRSLSDRTAATGSLQTTIVELRQEIRRASEKYATARHLLELLTAARRDPAHLVATPNRLLEALPALKRLKDGLIDAQLQTSRLMGTMSPEHPRVRAALVAEQEIRDDLHHELDVAVRGLQAEVNLRDRQLESLNAQLHNAEQRMKRLVAIRATYSTLTAEVQRRTENLTAIQHDLTAALARRAATESTNLITRVDRPQTGAFPSGPGRSVIIAVGAVGGLLIGLGILFVTVAPSPTEQVATPKTETAQVATPPTKPMPVPPTRPAFTRPAPITIPSASTIPTGEHLTLPQALARVADVDHACEPGVGAIS